MSAWKREASQPGCLEVRLALSKRKSKVYESCGVSEEAWAKMAMDVAEAWGISVHEAGRICGAAEGAEDNEVNELWGTQHVF